MRIIFACAGTGGHVTPALAIAKKIKDKDKDKIKENKNKNKNEKEKENIKEKSEILFIGTKSGMENEMVKKAGFEIAHIRTDKIIRKITFKNFKSLYTNYLGYIDAKKIIKEFKPDLIIGTGGYICVPVMYAAKSCNIKYILHESNAYPGMAVKLLAKNAQVVLTGFEEAKNRIKKSKKIIYTGTPIKLNREEYFKLDKEECKKYFKLPLDKKIIAISGGSQGAKKFNEVVIKMIKKYNNEKICFFLVTGSKNYDNMIKQLNEEKIMQNNNIIVKDFIYEMEMLYKACDLAVMRSGALTITELEMTGTPSILIPFPYATENHQLYNAKVLSDIGGSFCIIESDLDENTLYNKITEIIEDEKKLSEMSKKTSNKYAKEAVDEIYEIIQKEVLR